MKYCYRLTNANGVTAITTQNYEFSEQEILEFFQKDQPKACWTKCTKIESLKRGYTRCGCGKVFKGRSQELCDECKETYGHTYEYEL